MAQAQQSAPVERPPFHPGDRLTREEFERIWDCYPEIKKADLIDGQVYYEVSVSARHGEIHGTLTGWAAVCAAAHPELQMMPESTIRLEGDNDLQPNVMLRRRDKGSSLISQDWHVYGPPELAVEIAASAASYDLHVKRRFTDERASRSTSSGRSMRSGWTGGRSAAANSSRSNRMSTG